VRPLVIAVAVPVLLAGGIASARHWRGTPAVHVPSAPTTGAPQQATYPLDDVRRLTRPAAGLLGGRIVVSRSDCSVAVLDPTTGGTTALPVPHACLVGTSIRRARDGRYVRLVQVGDRLEAALYRRGGRRIATIRRAAAGVHPTRVVLSADAAVLVVATSDGGITVTTFAGRRLERRVGSELILSAAIDPTGSWIALGTDDGVTFLDAATLAPEAFTPIVSRDVRWEAA
jgi:hypothetical protein